MSDSYTKLLLHFNGDNAAVYIDDFGSSKVWTAGGTAALTVATKKFGRASLYLDGDTGYISTPDHADFTLGTTAFSFDFWVKFPTLPTATPQAFFSKAQDASNKYYLEIYDNSGVQTIRFRSKSGGVTLNDFSFPLAVLSISQWYHFELTLSGTTLYLFQDGAFVTSSGGWIEVSDITGAFEIGRNGTSGYLNAWVDEFRFTAGTARHTASFDVATAAYKRINIDDEYTAMLFHWDGADQAATPWDDATGLTLTCVTAGPPHLHTDNFKFGTASMFAPGGGYAALSTLPTRVFPWHRTYATIDFWVRFVNFTNIAGLISWNETVTISYDGTTTNKNLKMNATNIALSNALLVDTWYHFAFVKNAGTTTAYINGVSVGTFDNSTLATSLDTLAEAKAATTHRFPGTAYSNYYSGVFYLDELRTSADIQRWTEAFTPPTEPYGVTVVEVSTTDKLTVSDITQTTWDDVEPRVGISDTMELVREVDKATDDIAGITDTFDVLREVPFTSEHRAGISDEFSMVMEAELGSPHVAGITDLFSADVFIDEPGLFVTVPHLTFSATGQDGAIGTLSLSIPPVSLSWMGTAAPSGVLSISVPRMSFSATGLVNETGTLNVTLPIILFKGTAERGAVGTLSVTLPNVLLEMDGFLSASGVLSITIPMMRLSLVAGPVYLSAVLNIKNNALTEYMGYNFDSLCRFNGKNLGASATHIFDLDTGSTDDGELFDWNFRIPYIDLDAKNKKRLKQAWLSLKTSGDLIVTAVQPDGTEYEYDATGYEITEDGIRVKFGKGITSKYVAIDVRNVDGSSASLDVLRLNFDSFKKVR